MLSLTRPHHYLEVSKALRQSRLFDFDNPAGISLTSHRYGTWAGDVIFTLHQCHLPSCQSAESNGDRYRRFCVSLHRASQSHLTLKSLNPDGDFLGCFCGRNCLANDLKPGQSEIGLPKRDPNICSYPWRFPSYGKFSLLCCMFRTQNCSRRCPP